MLSKICLSNGDPRKTHTYYICFISLPRLGWTSGAKSKETQELRQRIRDGIESQVWDFFTTQGGQVVIYDANNGDRQSRKDLREKFEARGVHVIWLETMCDREDIITANIRRVKLGSPDVSIFPNLNRSVSYPTFRTD